MSGSDEANCAADAIRIHLLQGIGQEGMPVTHADVDGQRVAHGSKSFAQAIGLPLSQLSQR